ncbi:DUF4293 domain-containing protein [Portibacter lacus]|uniref:Membrane protein n=1 Tax=Portibacter lacus TaxID=1099794 RepID=A0AA37SMQ1_9BACT|nr:DUF4293 domain-containing protein [Portibacter lacus]GLR16652.1 membrane protein [Portibacter lacus]
MIQRIQTIFLFLASASFFGLFGVPLATSNDTMAGIFADKIYNIFDNPVLLGITIVGGLLALITIFLFKNRPLQKKLVYGVMTMGIIFIIVALLLVFQDNQSDLTANINEQFGIGLPILAILFGIFANRYIGKDDKLVKSMDRLR